MYLARLPLELGGVGGGLSGLIEMKLLRQGLILEVWVLVEMKVDLISAFDVVKFLHF